jgi:uncharacterized lipoprotein YddW (UPF0748 family)
MLRDVSRWRIFGVLVGCVLLLGAAAPPQPAASCDAGSVGMRAVWIATVSNTDWPSKPGLDVADQQREYRAILDNAVRLRLNTVIVQVRPTADALWPSRVEPWSQWLTGTQGKDPGYDPLAFLVSEAHARGLAFHAWFNPFRVSKQADPAQLVPSHPARVHPDWVFSYGGGLYYNPGLPEVREFVTNAVMDAVQRYDVDAVHFDDYFYPYPKAGEPIPDGGVSGDQRRANIDQFVKGMAARIHAAKPGVKFGISPFGIWRNRADDSRGSETSGITSYDTTYADTYTWIKNKWVDYVVPQVYWEIGHPSADYAKLVPWWAGAVAGTGVDLYIGQAAYKVGGSPAWDDAELAEHLALNRSHPAVHGDVFFSAKSLTSNAAAAMGRVSAENYTGCAG